MAAGSAHFSDPDIFGVTPVDEHAFIPELEVLRQSDTWIAQEKAMIASFFEKLVPPTLAPTDALPTQLACDDFAKRALQTEDLRPVDIQSATRYTLICPSQRRIVQFRLKRFDEDVLALARRFYGDLVPRITYIGGFLLPVYVSPVIPGRLHYFQPFPSARFPLERQLTTVVELAQLLAKSAFWPQSSTSSSPASWTKVAPSVLEKLTQNKDLESFEPRFKERATELLRDIHLLDYLPLVFSHPFLTEMNIVVNQQGSLTGVIDFEDARTEVFGICFYGIYEGFFGSMKDQKWKFHDQDAGEASGKSVRRVLESAFWETLWYAVPAQLNKYRDAVAVALDIGIMIRYFAHGMLDKVDWENEENIISLEFARGILLDR